MAALPKQVDYTRNIHHAVRYKHLAVPLANNASGSVTGVTNTSQLLQWKLPAGVVINLARSHISYTVDVQGTGAAYNWVADDNFQIAQSLSLVTAQGIPLAEVNDCQRYTKLVDKYYTRHDDFISRGNTDISYPCDTLEAANPIVPVIAPVNTYGITAGPKVDGFVPYREPRYFKIGTALNGILSLAKHQRLGDIRNTLFEQDKDLYFGDSVYLNLQTAPVDTFAFTSTSGTSLTAGAPVALAAGKCSINNLMLNLAIEDNVLLAQSVIEKFRTTGITLRTDFLSSVRNVCNSAVSNVSVQIPMNPNAKLKRIINCIFSGNNTLASAQDCSNIGGVKIANYQTILDAQPLQNTVITCVMSAPSTGAGIAGFLGNGDYRENESWIRNSAIAGVPMYQQNWIHLDEFAGMDSLEYGKDYSNTDGGLDLNVPRVYQLNLSTPNAPAAPGNYAQYCFMVISKTLHIGADGIMFH